MFFSSLAISQPVSRPVLLVSVLAACLAIPARAQSDTNETPVPVVVTASRIEQSQKEAIPSTTVITSETIRNKRPTDVFSLLRNVAGVQILQNGSPGTVASVFMRGANSNQMLILIDGVPVRNVSSTGSPAALEHILPEQIDRIEIVRGNVSAIYGSGAIGGVIQIFTKEGSDKASYSVSGEVGSNSTTKVNAALSGKVENTRYSLSATRYKTDGFSSMRTTPYSTANRDDDGDRNVSINAAVSNEWRKGHELGIRFYGYDAKYDYDNGTSLIDDSTGESRQWTVAFFSKNRITENWKSTVNISHTEIRNEFDAVDEKTLSEADYKSESSLLQWTNEIALSPQWVMTLGVDGSHDKARSNSSYIEPPWVDSHGKTDNSRNSYSAYAGLNGSLDSHHFQINARYDHINGFDSDTTGYFGYGYDLTDSWKLVASASTAFLAPTLYQLHGGDANVAANSRLKAEKSRSYEVGIQYAKEATLLRATLFDSRTHDQINYGPYNMALGKFQFENTSKAKNRGLEISVQTRLAGVDIHGSLTMQQPEDDKTNEILLRRSKRLAALGASRTFGRWYLGADAQYVGHRPDSVYDPATFSNKRIDMGSYWLANLYTRFEITKEVSVFGRIENLFDREYETIYSYKQPERAFYIGLNWKM